MSTNDRRKFTKILAKASISRARGGLMVRSSDSTTFLGESHGVLCLRVDEVDGIGLLMAITPVGSTEVARGPREEMEALCDRAWHVMRSDWPTAIAMSFGLIGLLVGVLVSGGAMFAMNDPQLNHSREPIVASVMPAPTVLALPPTTPRAVASAIPRVMPPAIPLVMPAPIAEPTASLAIAPPTSKPDGKPTFQDMVQRLMQSDAVRGKQVVDTIQSMSTYVRAGQEIPEELIENLPTDILQKMVEDAQEAGVTDIRIRPKGTPPLTLPGAPAAALPGAPTLALPGAPTLALPGAPAAVQPTQREVPIVGRQSQASPAAAPVSPPATPSVVERPLIWGGPNGETVPRDMYGIQTVPELNSRAARPGSIELPGLGGGTMKSTTELRSFSLPTE